MDYGYYAQKGPILFNQFLDFKQQAVFVKREKNEVHKRMLSRSTRFQAEFPLNHFITSIAISNNNKKSSFSNKLRHCITRRVRSNFFRKRKTRYSLYDIWHLRYLPVRSVVLIISHRKRNVDISLKYLCKAAFSSQTPEAFHTFELVHAYVKRNKITLAFLCAQTVFKTIQKRYNIICMNSKGVFETYGAL